MLTTTEHVDAVSRGPKLERGTMREEKESSKNYKGFVAGIFSGIAKLSG